MKPNPTEIGKAPAIPRRETAPNSSKLARPKIKPAEKIKACAVLLESKTRSPNGRSAAALPTVKAASSESNTAPKAKSREKSSKRQRLPASLNIVIHDPRQRSETRKSANKAVGISRKINKIDVYCELCGALCRDTSAVGGPPCSGVK